MAPPEGFEDAKAVADLSICAFVARLSLILVASLLNSPDNVVSPHPIGILEGLEYLAGDEFLELDLLWFGWFL